MSQRLYDCPQCGAPVAFRSSIAVFAVCEHCRSMIVAKGSEVESMGVMAQLPPDMTPFQIGTTGQWQGTGFSIVGRVRVSWADGSWNEWCLLFVDGRTGWLGEAQGLLMISFAVEASTPLPRSSDKLQAGGAVEVNGQTWAVVDVKDTICVAGEGELPFVAPPSRKRTSVDLTDSRGAFGSLEFYEEGPQFYAGSFASFSDLHFENLRPVPGWNGELAQEKNQTAALACPSCGASVNLRAAGLTMAATCGSCGSIIDTANPQLELIQAAHVAQQKLPHVLPIGQRGTLHGTEWEAIGVCKRGDQYATWLEYLLFNPWRGFSWLVTYDGHWSFVDRLTGMGNVSGNAVNFDNREFRLFAAGDAAVRAVLGEFYWKVRVGEQARLSDFIAPPNILSKEVYGTLNEFTWSYGTYVPRQDVAAAFQLKNLPPPVGIYLNQPNPHEARWSTVKALWLVAIAAAVVLQLFFLATNQEDTAFETFNFAFIRPAIPASPGVRAGPNEMPLEAADNVHVTPHFQVKRTGRVDIEGTANVNNSWLGLDLDLVNVATGEHLPADLEIGYYHGSDSDGSWSEGGRTELVSIPGVPAGEYFLTIEASADPAIKEMPFRVRVFQGGIFWVNFILVIIAISLYPLLLLARRHMFERARWGESDFSPYAGSDQ